MLKRKPMVLTPAYSMPPNSTPMLPSPAHLQGGYFAAEHGVVDQQVRKAS